MICKLVELGLIFCMGNTPGVRTVECQTLNKTMICVDVKEDIGCFHDSAEDFFINDNGDDISLVHWLNANCDGFVGGNNES